MSRHIDLSNKLTNERPTVTIGGNTYEVNDEKSNVLMMNQKLKEGGSEAEIVDKVITLLLGEKALKEIDAMGYGISQYMTIFYALIACVNDITIEEAQERFQNQK